VTGAVDLDTLVRRIHAAPVQFVLAITGGGSRAIAELLERPGASRVLLEAIVPYSSAALVDLLGATPEKFCSPRTARLMAMAAYQRALHLASEGQSLASGGRESPDQIATPNDFACIGLGCTASLTSDRPKRGDHRIHVAYQTHDVTAEFSLVLVKDRRTRFEEEGVAAIAILNALSGACGGLGKVALPTHGDEPPGERRSTADEARQELLHGQRRQVLIGRVPIIATGARRAVFPGAFNPLHEGHREMARIARQRLDLPIEFELSMHNVDKPPLDYLEMNERAEQFGTDETLWLTRAPTFEEKCRLFPDATFIVGADTIARIADPAYYGGSQRAMLAAIDRIAGSGGQFLVFGRTNDSEARTAETDDPISAKGFQTIASLDLPPALSAMCTEVPESEFRADVSSTQLRKERQSLAD
jgi:nicotinamide mononucleotide (NMN) deamidase PncC